VLLHYKLLAGHLHKQATQAGERTAKGSVRYSKYLEVLDKDASTSIKTDTSKELKSVNDLVSTRFVSVSRQYMRFVESGEQTNGVYSEESRSERLFAAFFNAKEEVTALAEQMETMREQNRTLRRIPNQAEMRKLRRELEQMRRESEQMRRDFEEVQRLRHGDLEDIRRLHRELEYIKSSRGWKIANGINVAIIKARSIFKGNYPSTPQSD
jgi:predicted RNase H-like nuclease (RuvC/YqgF family)